VTELPVGRLHALIDRCTVTRVRISRRPVRHQRPAGRLVRRCSQVAVPRKGGIVKLRFRQEATVTGLVQTADGQPIAGAQVQATQQAAGWRRHAAGTVTSNSHGEFRYTIPAGPSRTITFSFPGSPTLRASAGTTTVRVMGKARIKVGRRAQAGRRLGITGRVLGGYIPSGGVLVQLQYRISGVPDGWSPFHTPVRTDSQGRWSVTFPVPGRAAGYTYLFRAWVASQNAWPFSATISNASARTVT
jgi:hypothetical protein